MHVKLKYILTAHRGPVTTLYCTDTHLYSGSADGTVSLYQVTGDPIFQKRIFGFSSGISSIDVDEGKQEILVGCDDSVQLVNIQTNKPIVTYSTKAQTSTVLLTNTLVFAGHADAAVYVYERYSGSLLSTFRGHETVVLALQYSQYHQVLISSGQDGKVVFYDIANCLTLHTMKLGAPVVDIRLSRNENCLGCYVLGIGIMILKLNWKQLSMSSLIRQIKNDVEKCHLHQICFLQGKTIFAGDGRLAIFDLTSGEMEEEIQIATGTAMLSLAKNNAIIVSGGYDSRTYIYKLEQ